jgi:hypothetical protein
LRLDHGKNTDVGKAIELVDERENDHHHRPNITDVTNGIEIVADREAKSQDLVSSRATPNPEHREPSSIRRLAVDITKRSL